MNVYRIKNVVNGTWFVVSDYGRSNSSNKKGRYASRVPRWQGRRWTKKEKKSSIFYSIEDALDSISGSKHAFESELVTYTYTIEKVEDIMSLITAKQQKSAVRKHPPVQIAKIKMAKINKEKDDV